MIGSISGSDALGAGSSLNFPQQALAAIGLTGSSGPAGSAGAGGAANSSASISGPGQLLSNLQQLQAKDPAKFKQVVSDIASQLQAAAQQSQGPQSDFLANLASKFQNVANGGSLSQLQPPQRHHGHHGHHAYSQNAQDSSQGLAGFGQAGNGQGSDNSSLQKLFASISSEVSQALKA